MSDLERAFNTLSGKQLKFQTLFEYYAGNQPLVYSAQRLRELFQDKLTRFNQNWAAAVVDATLDRLSLTGFDPVDSGNKEVDKTLDEIWGEYDLGLDADEVHKSALITGEGYLIVWKQPDGSLDVYHNSPTMCHVFYQADRPKIKKFAGKWYKGDDKRWHITLYYPDRIEYYVSSSEDPTEASSFKQEKKLADNPFGVIPVFHFKCPGDIDRIVSLQDAINKEFADMMVASEFSAFKQRWVISNADISDLKNSPNEIWNIPAGDGQSQQSSVGEFDGEDLSKFMTVIERLANVIAISTKTPRNYLTDVGAGISGDALIAMEAPLVKKCEKRIKQFSSTWKEVAAFLYKLKTDKELSRLSFTPQWSRVKSDQPLAEYQAINFAVSSGIPLNTVLRWQGHSKEEINQMQADIKADKKEKASMSKELLELARIKSNQNDETGEEDPSDGTV